MKNNVKIAILQKVNSRINELWIKITMPFLTETDKNYNSSISESKDSK